MWFDVIATIPSRVLVAIENELSHQRNKFGASKEQSLPGFLLIMRQELDEAISGWMKPPENDRDSCLHEVLQVVATGVACLSHYGVKGCARSTFDVTERQMAEERAAAVSKALNHLCDGADL